MGSVFHEIASSRCELGLGEVTKHETAKNRSSPVCYFFHAIWQKQPAIYRATAAEKRSVEEDERRGGSGPLDRAFGMTWDDVASLIHHCRHDHPTAGTSPPLYFQNGTPITDPYAVYALNPHAAYLDGCSIIVNHADFHHPIISQLCDNLQQTFREKLIVIFITSLGTLVTCKA